ncbi:alpha-L-fucosidase [Parapedobacter sp. 10938]|uniref:alpha-L-fucosidase n=1 Tax=Parapedobacter flavus TaxID=3110225 RepID=UPI002DBA31EA|nr:alpha-L-fucosidase [Parapedobacter sp. 10938]MEC3880622.1 alpha-L-fucosidase [Parapedobacter sp. 10938]
MIGINGNKCINLISLAALIAFGACDSSDGQQKNEPAPYGPIPTAAQLNWHEMELYGLIHFTPTTFQNKEWGFGDAPASLFNPQHFDANQIAAAAKSAGFKGLISVAKHHDGFCLWPTKTTDYNITHSPWRNGSGDMVKEFMEAVRKQGMQFGIYVSAWDRHDPEYGNEKYADAYREQLRELYSGYGELFTSWHDGANGGDGYYGGANEMRKIDRSSYYEWQEKTWPITREMQPTAVIFSDIGPDTRWVGNEKGIAPETSWATFTPIGPDGGKAAPGHIDDRFLGTGKRDGKFWIPAECDVPLRPGWFYHPEQDNQVKSPDQLFDLYLKSVGRGAALNLGLAPNTDGLLHPADVAALEGFGIKLTETFATNLAAGAQFEASNVREGDTGHFGPDNLLDDDRYSYWASDDDMTSPELIIDLGSTKTFDLIRLRENIKLGQRLDSVWVDVWNDTGWTPLARATSIGASRIIPLEEPIIAQRLRLRLFAPVAVALSDFGLFRVAQTSYSLSETVRVGVDRANWQMIDNDFKGGDPALAVDGKKETFWLTAETDLPQQLVVDMGHIHTLSGFGYLPRQDGETAGLVSRYKLATSRDGITWDTTAAGEFANIVANPIEQYVAFDNKVEARYFRFTVDAIASAEHYRSRVSIAEFNIYNGRADRDL